jgi:hypothetical protein
MIDTVGVYDESFRQVFEIAQSLKVSVKEESKLFDHPLEDGSVITDFSIVLPTVIELSIIVSNNNYKNVYNSMREGFINGTKYQVQTKTGLYKNMIIESMPHEEDPAYFDAIAIALKLREVVTKLAQFAALPPSKVKNQKHSTTVKKGNQQPKETTKVDGGNSPNNQGSILYGIFN